MLLCWGGIDFPSVSYALRIRQSCLYLESTLSFTRKFCSWILLFLWKNNVTVNVRVFHFLLQFCYMSNVSIVNWFLNANLPFLLRWAYKGIGLPHKRKKHSDFLMWGISYGKDGVLLVTSRWNERIYWLIITIRRGFRFVILYTIFDGIWICHMCKEWVGILSSTVLHIDHWGSATRAVLSHFGAAHAMPVNGSSTS